MHGRIIALRVACTLLVSPPAAAQTPPVPAQIDLTDADPALWVVRDEDTTIYLFGTIHVLRPGVTWFDDGVRKAFEESDELVTEIPEREFVDMVPLLLQRAGSDDGKTLTEHLTVADAQTYRQAMARLGLSAQALEPVEPWVPAFLLLSGAGGSGGSRYRYSARYGVEVILSRAARERGMAMSGLESLDMQLGFFDNLTNETQVSLLNAMVQSVVDPRGSRSDSGMEHMIGVWASGNATGISADNGNEFDAFPELRDALLVERNQRWAQWIQLRLNEAGGRFFVAVGAAHLAGPHSVQAQLTAMGIPVQRVEY